MRDARRSEARRGEADGRPPAPLTPVPRPINGIHVKTNRRHVAPHSNSALPEMSQSKPNFKCILIGDSGVGKSCLMMRFSDDTFNQEFVSTIGVDFTNRTMDLDGERVKCQLWDTAGQERFRTLTTSYYRDAQGVAIVYDVSDRRSFDNVQAWKADVERYASPDVAMMIMGNKADLGEHRAVTFAEGGELARVKSAKGHEALFFETSAKDSYNVEEAFVGLGTLIKERGLIRDTSASAARERQAGGSPGAAAAAAAAAGGGGGSPGGGGAGYSYAGDAAPINLAGEGQAGQEDDLCCGGGGGGGRDTQPAADAAMAPVPVGAGIGETTLSDAAAAASVRAKSFFNTLRTSASAAAAGGAAEGRGGDEGGGRMHNMAVGQGRPDVQMTGVRGSNGGFRYEYDTVDSADGAGAGADDGRGGGSRSPAARGDLGGGGSGESSPGGRLSSLDDER